MSARRSRPANRTGSGRTAPASHTVAFPHPTQITKENGIYGGLVFFLAPEQERFEQLIRTWGSIVADDDCDDFVCHAMVASPPVPPFDGQRTVTLQAGWIGSATADEAKAKLDQRLAPLLALEPVICDLGIHSLPQVRRASLAMALASAEASARLPCPVPTVRSWRDLSLSGTAQQHAERVCRAGPKVAQLCV